jgi:hypothetical protein
MQDCTLTAGISVLGSTGRTRRRLVAGIGGALFALAVLSPPAAAHGPPAHPHVLLLHAEWTGSGPSTQILSYERCVDLANGRSLPNPVHHDTVHEGRAGAALRSAGHLVVPFRTCSDL